MTIGIVKTKEQASSALMTVADKKIAELNEQVKLLNEEVNTLKQKNAIYELKLEKVTNLIDTLKGAY